MFSHKKAMIIDTKKDMQKVYKKLLAHPLFVSDYVVYYARVARTFYIGLAPVCVCVCVCVCVTLLFGSAK